MALTHRGSQLHLDQIYSPDLSGGDNGIQIVTTDSSPKGAGLGAVWDTNGNVIAGASSSGTVTSAISVNGAGISTDYNYSINGANPTVSINGQPAGTSTSGTYSITGSIVGVGGAVDPGATIALTATGVSLQTATDSNGAWSIGGLVAGTYTITPSQPGYSFAPTSKSVTISAANISTPGFTASQISSGTGSTSVADQIYGDMVGGNEGYPHGVPSSYDFYSGPFISEGNNPGSNTALEWWSALYVDSGGNPASNTQVEVYGCQLWWLRASTGEWIEGMAPTTTIDGGYYSEDFQTDYGTPVSFTTISADSAIAYDTTSGEVAHCFAPYPRVAIDNTDVGGVVTCFFGRLTLINPTGTDDRTSAKLLGTCGADYYPTTTSAGIENNPGVAGGKFKYFTTSWRSFCMTTMTQSALRLNPPPINFTGISA